MKKGLKSILVATLAFSLVGCANSPTSQMQPANPAGDIFKANYNEIYDELFDEKSASADLIMTTIFDELDYKTLKSEIDGDIAYVTTEISALDVVSASILATEEYTMLCLEDALSGKTKSEGEELNILKKYLKRAEKVDTIITLEMEKEEGKWNLVINDDLLYAITGSNGVFDLFSKYVDDGYELYSDSNVELYMVEKTGSQVKFYVSNKTFENQIILLDDVFVNYLAADVVKKVSLSPGEALTFKIDLKNYLYNQKDIFNIKFDIYFGDIDKNLKHLKHCSINL